MQRLAASRAETLRRLSRAAAAGTVAVAGLVSLGWLVNSRILVTIVPDGSATHPNTGLALLLAGLSLWVLLPFTATGAAERPANVRRPARGLAMLCGLAIALIGAITLAEYLSGRDLGIDRGILHAAAPGRMAANTALNFLLVGIATLALGARGPRLRRLAEPLALLSGSVAIVALVGYVYGVAVFQHVGTSARMSVPTAVAFLLLAVGTLAAVGEGGLLDYLMSQRIGVLIIRQLLPAALVAPVIIAWLRLEGQRAGWYDSETGLALYTVANMMLFTFVIWRGARSLDRIDAQRRAAEDSLGQHTHLLDAVLDGTTDMVFIKDLSGRYLMANAATAQFVGRDVKDILGKDDRQLFPAPVAERIIAADAVVLASGETRTYDDELVIDDRKRVYVSTKGVFRDSAGRVAGLFGFSRDVTERRQLADQFRQAQKMEAIGRLTAGIAHDFNNVLGIVTTTADLLQAELPPGDPRASLVEDIDGAAKRAADLVHQLLAFSRQQILQPRVLELNAVLADLHKLFGRIIGKDIDLALKLDPDLGRVLADRGQVEQIVLNLAVNARDAMRGGGVLTLETMNAELDETYVEAHDGGRAGRYVLIAITDTGLGMDQATQARIFEPFFTTKERGQGTGLGLASVYGIVKQSGGFIWVYSEPGRGSTFKIYLPRVEDPVIPDAAPAVPARSLAARGETVLVVDDDDGLRTAMGRILRRYGYRVIEAQHGAEALALCTRQQEPMHLVVTDLVMPGLGGHELAERIRALASTAKILFVSGYSSDFVRSGDHGPGTAFLAKPFTMIALAAEVRGLLDQPLTAGESSMTIEL